MCGRFSLGVNSSDLAAALGLDEIPDFTPRFNIAPSQFHPILRAPAARPGWEWRMARWGLIPHWAKDPGMGTRMINARAETIAEKPAFRVSFRHKRCLIPADGFYEWSGEGSDRTPHFIFLVTRELFTFAGLWESWSSPAGKPLESFTIVTTKANDLLRPLHDRMPVIIPPDQRQAWTDPAQDDLSRLEHLLHPFPAEAMRHHPVSHFVNNPRNEGPACRDPA